MLRRVAVVPVPLLSPRLAAPQAALVTDVGTAVGCALVASMTNEVVVRDHSIRELLPLDPMRKGERRAEGLGERAQAELRP